MWKCFVLCMLAFVTLCQDVYGHIGDDMTETIQLCCNEGTSHARNHTSQECSVPVAMPADVPATFGNLCGIARTQCCNEYFQKKQDCETGVDIATSIGYCDSTKDHAKVCCNECVKGTTVGHKRSSKRCNTRTHGKSAEELLADDAYTQCCKNAVKGRSNYEIPSSDHSKNYVTVSKRSGSMASLCEEYAPNELCAHHCIPVPGSYKCECNHGFMLMADGRNCKEVVKNRCKPRNPCQHKCNDNGVEVLCSCRRGYELMPDGKSCQDIDECLLDIPVCLPGTRCYNIQGSYRCIPMKKSNHEEKGQCPPGFAKNLNNNACDDINECKLPNPPCPFYLCENTVGGYKCGGVSGDPVNLSNVQRAPVEDKCPPGFRFGSNEECVDVDECAIHKDDCNPLSQFCINTHSSFYCQDKVSKHCPPGFKINPSTNKCEDIDECEDDGDICRADQVCINQLGQYDCKEKVNNSRQKANQLCPDGMRMNPTTLVCEDINECVEGTHLCDQYQNCLNTNGSFECHCKLGYELDITTGACIDVNECATGQHDCIIGSQRCDNTVGSFLCIRITSCGTGYILHHATSNCEDIDECALGTHNCARAGPEYQCFNLPGSFRCVRRRPTTTSTTAEPEYEYYYDSEEEPEGSETAKDVGNKPEDKPVEPVTATPESSSVTPQTTPDINTEAATSAPLESPTDAVRNGILPQTNDKEPGRGDAKQPEITYSEPPLTNFQPKQEAPEITFSYSEPNNTEQSSITNHIDQPTYEYVPEQTTEKQPDVNYESNIPNSSVQPNYPESTDYERGPETPYKPISSNEVTTEISNSIDIPSEPRQPEPIEPRQPEPFEPRQPEPIEPRQPEPIEPQQPEPVKPRQPEPTEPYRPEPTEPHHLEPTEPGLWKPTESDQPEPTESRQPTLESTYSPIPEQTDSMPTHPHAVFVNVGKESATVPGERKSDGSVVVDTQNVPKNKWTKINVKPIDCPPGFEANEYGGCFDIDECTSNRHTCSGLTEVCRNSIGGYLCDCAPGFRRDFATGTCAIPTTTSTTTTTTTTTSRNFFWGYPDFRPVTTRPFRPRNWCDAGFHLNSNTGRCEDINECTNGQANCAAVEICVNTEGGYRCECPPNWRLDEIRHRCIPLKNNEMFPSGYGNEPVHPSIDNKDAVSHGTKGTKYVPPQITQVEDRGSVFKCPWGYRLGDDNNCEDIDECSTGKAKCGPIQICTNLPGGYTCSCPQGHRLVGDHECEDVDECQMAGNMSICSHNADCVNTIGSYQCKCHNGFRSAPVNDKVCVDVDECTESRPGTLCQHRCNNVWGSYRCSCHRGYRINTDNRTCSDVDECVQFKSKLPCVGRCLNEPGSYRCTCPTGYRLSEDKRSCIDIDECETGEATCSKSGMFGGTSHVCFNTRGSYRCHRITCPPGYQLESKHRCTKTERVCSPGDWECAHQPTTISYNFITFVSKLYVPDSKVKLFTMRGPAWSYAKMKFQLRLVDVNAPPNVKDKADINAFLLIQNDNEAVMSLVRPLEGPQSIELELSMELYSWEQFGGIAVARLFIYVSEYEF